VSSIVCRTEQQLLRDRYFRVRVGKILEQLNKSQAIICPLCSALEPASAPPYTVQAIYLGHPYFSETFTGDDSTVLIPEGMARGTLLQGGTALANIQVLAISDSDPDHPQVLITNESGVTEFRLPAGAYTFKAPLQVAQYCLRQYQKCSSRYLPPPER